MPGFLKKNKLFNVTPPAKNRGYTLIEMAIVMVVLGLLLAAFIGAYNIYYRTQVEEKTTVRVNKVVDALANYLIQNGRYPCPARMDLGREDAGYGMQGDCVADTSVAPGQCANGICVEEGERMVNIDPNPGVVNMVTPRIRRGAVPFRELSLPEDDSEDGQGNKLYYVVTENLANQATYRKDAGGISIVDTNDSSAIAPDASAHFVVFSVGADGRGAYTRYGQQVLPCPDPSEAMDAINCHTGNAGADVRAIYRVSSRATTDSNTHYDDYLKYYSSNQTPLWRMVNAQDIADLLDVPAGGRVGIGNSTPTNPLQVQGDIHINDSLTAADLCNNTHTDEVLDDCFDPNLIAGNEPAMRCENAGEHVVAVRNGRVVCGTSNFTPCDVPGSVAVGIELNANGVAVPICEGVRGCDDMTVLMCQVDGVQETAYIPTGLEGDVFETPVSGVSFRRRYTCNGEQWVPASPATTGICSCTPETGGNAVSCSSSGIMPGTGTVGNAGATRCNYTQCWTGTASRPWERTCPDNVVTYEPVDNDGCTCREPYTRSRTRTCGQIGHPSGWSWSGTQPRETTTWTCTGDQSGVWSGWTLVEGTDTCVCEEETHTRTLSCNDYYNSLGQNGAGYTGSGVQQQQTITCPGPVVGPWTNIGGVDCACNPDAFISGTDTCPEGMIGTISWRRFMDCSTGDWGEKTITNNGCSEPYYRWQQAAQQIPGNGVLPDKLGNECPTPNVTSTCSIPSGSGYAHYPCRCQ